MNELRDEQSIISNNGIASLGKTLTAKSSDTSGVPTESVSYQWMAGGNPIRGATERTYTPDSGVVGEKISVKTTYSNDASTGLKNDPATITIDGTPKLGEMLTAQISDANGVPSKGVSYQWMAGGNPIKGATDKMYTPDTGVIGDVISVKASYTDNANFIERPVSLKVDSGIVSKPNGSTPSIDDSVPSTGSSATNANAASISLSGNKTGTLTAKISDADGVPSSGVTYSWFADGKSISGATKSSYKLTSDEAGKTITVEASYTDNAGFTETAISDSNVGIYIPNAATTLVVDVTDYGAKGNGRTNDTESIQGAIDFVANQGGGIVLIPNGNYLVDTVSTIRMRSNVTVKMEDDAVVEGIPNSAENFYVFLFKDVENAHLIGGTIVGDRDDHIGTRGDYGMGVGIMGSRNITVESVDIRDSWGDGVYIGDSKGKSEDITIYNVVSDNNRRQGITIVDGDGIHIINSVFMNTNGADPSAGIDIEPDNGNLVTNVNILSSKFLNNQGNGIVISERAAGVNNEITNILVDGNEVTGNIRNILVNGVTDGKITNNIVDGVGTAFSADGRVLTGIALDEGTSNIEVSGNTVVTTGNEIRHHDIDDRGQGNEVYDNFVTGTSGNNNLQGGFGNDILDGSYGRDILTGRDGADIFMFSSKLGGSNIDTITDFSARQNDKIGLSDVIFGGFENQGLIDNWFTSNSNNIDADTRIIQKGSNLYFDADGSGNTFVEVQFATVNQTLTVDDFVVM